jgi:hypothetical protein
MATSPLFGWEEPDDVDLVKDGAAAIRTLGNAIDTSMGDLLGGTTGQVLSKNSNTNMDFTWVTSDDANAIQNTIVDAKGDLIGATASDTPARLAVGTNGQVLTADSTAATGLAWATASAGSSNVAGKNAILNSNFSVWQRGTSISLAANAGITYLADRWATQTAANQACTVSRQVTGDTTNLPFIQYCLRYQRNSGQTGTDALSMIQPFETVNSVPLAGKTVTVSFYARAGANFSATSSILTYLVRTGTGTDQMPFNAYTGGSTTFSGNVTLTTTWQRFTATATLPTDTTEIAPQFYYVPTGTAGAADYYEITGVQLEIASTASAYSPNTSTQALELAACQRYYQRLTSDTNGILVNYAFCSNSTLAIGQYQYIVPMRTVPTSLDFSSVRFRNHAGSAFNMSSILFNEASAFAAQIYGTISGGTAEQPGSLLASATPGFIGLSAEL